MLRSIYVILLISFCVLPSVSRSIFTTWSCESFGLDDSTDKVAYMRSDWSVECGQEQHNRLKAASWGFFVMWPIGVPLLYVALLQMCRRAITHHHPSYLSTSIRFLWKEYRDQFFWWEPIEMARKLALTSFILFIDTADGYNKLARLLVALLITLLFLVLTQVAHPYRQKLDNSLAAGSHLLLACCFIAGIVLKLCDDSKDGTLEGQWGEAPCMNIVGLASATQAAVLMVGTTMGMLVGVFVLLVWQIAYTPRPVLLKL